MARNKIEVSVTDDERAAFIEVAKSEGLRLATWAKATLLKAARKGAE